MVSKDTIRKHMENTPTRLREKRTEPYTPAEGGWVKVKHRDYWRFGQGLESPGGAVLD